MRRAIGVVLLLAMLAIAGCSNLVGSGPDAQQTLTPVPVSNDSTGVGGADDRIAPGLTTDGIVDSRRFLRNHAALLANSSYTLRRRVSRQYPNGSIRSTSETVIHRNTTAVRVRHSRTVYRGANGTVTGVERWSTNGTTYTALLRENGTRYERSTATDGAGTVLETAEYSESLGQILMHLPVAVGAPTEVDGTTVYPVAVTERRDVFPLRNVSFTGNVTERGIITEYRLEYEVFRDGIPISVTVRNSVTTGPTTVDRPDWLPEAINATS